MGKLRISEIRESASCMEIDNIDIAADIIRMVVELKDNSQIIGCLKMSHGINGKGNALKRKINGLIQNYIINNYFEEFECFCKKNCINIFNKDLEAKKAHSSYARIIYIVFLREEMGLKPPIRIVE